MIDDLGCQVVSGSGGKQYLNDKVSLNNGDHPLLCSLSSSRRRYWTRYAGHWPTSSIPACGQFALFAGRPNDLVRQRIVVSWRDSASRNASEKGLVSSEHFSRALEAGELQRIDPNSFEQLLTVARQILSEAEDIDGWRGEPNPVIRNVGSFSWPPQSDLKPRFADLSEEAG